MAAEALVRPIFAPMIATVVGSLGLGAQAAAANANAAAGGGGSGGGFNLFNLLSGASSINNLTSGGGWLSQLFGGGGAAAGGSGIIGGAGGATMAGDLLGTGGLVSLADASAAAAGGAGAGLGAAGFLAAATPFIIPAAIAAAVFILPKLLGGKTSVGPGGSAIIGVNQAGVSLSATTADNGFNPNDLASNTMQVGQMLQRFAKQLGGTLSQTNIGIDATAQGAGGGFRWWANTAKALIEGRSGTFDEAGQAAVLTALKSGAVTSANDNVNLALKNSKATDLQGLLTDVEFAKALDDLGKTLSIVETAVKSLNDSFDATAAKARDLGISTEALEATRQTQLAKLGADYVQNLSDQLLAIKDPFALQRLQETRRDEQAIKDLKTLNQSTEVEAQLHAEKMLAIQTQQDAQATALAQQAAQQATQDAARAAQDQARVTDQLRNLSTNLRDFVAGLATSNLSPLSPRDQYNAAYNQFQETRGAARAGDTAALQALPKVAQDFLAVSQSFNANTVGFATDFEQVRTSLSALASQIDNAVGRNTTLIDFGQGSAFSSTLVTAIGNPIGNGFSSLLSVANENLKRLTEIRDSGITGFGIVNNTLERIEQRFDSNDARLADIVAVINDLADRPQGRSLAA
jgi:hypothetical protein